MARCTRCACSARTKATRRASFARYAYLKVQPSNPSRLTPDAAKLASRSSV